MRSVLLILSFVFLFCYSCKKDAEKQSEPPKEEIIDVESVNEIEEETIEEVIEEETEKIIEEETEKEIKEVEIQEPTYDTEVVAADDPVKVFPISHGTLILEYDKMVIYVDPVGGADLFKEYRKPTLILVTDIHGDHLNVETIEAVKHTNTLVIAPKAVSEKLPSSWSDNISVLANGQTSSFGIGDVDISIEAIPMYNLREEALKFHTKYRGNGYVITMGDQRIYISGDTEDIPEMRQLQNIDKAFVCMNLPYTMTVESAASAVLDFKPKTVYPYHYRGTGGLSDVSKFKKIVNAANTKIDVRLLNWYPNR